MKPVYVIDYVVIDTLGSDIKTNYSDMMSLAKGPQTITRYDINQYSNVFSTKGYEMSFYPSDNILSRLQGDLVNQIINQNQLPQDTSVVFGSFSTTGGYAVREGFFNALESGSTRYSPTKLFINNTDLFSAGISKRLQLEGLSTSLNAACSTSMFNLHYVFNCMQTGAINSALVGAMELPFYPHTQYYWQSTSAISTKDGGICKPFDKSRDGFLQAEGGTLWWICDEETVKKYNLTPKAKILAVEASAKCHGEASMTAHDRTGVSQIRVIEQALRNANKTPKDMAFFNAHATSTPVGDDIEFDVFTKVFEDVDIPCVSFKGHIGHTMSACGMIESAYGLEAVKNKLLQPNFDLTDPLSDDPRLITTPCQLKSNVFMKASFGFGGRTVIAIFESLE
jgi:3-oxoacyl-(acyl-carrier-protein) synthase